MISVIEDVDESDEPEEWLLELSILLDSELRVLLELSLTPPELSLEEEVEKEDSELSENVDEEVREEDDEEKLEEELMDESW